MNGCAPRQNRCYLFESKTIIFHNTFTMLKQKLNVWAGIFDAEMVGPCLLPDKLTCEMYLQILYDAINPSLTNIVQIINRIMNKLRHCRMNTS